MDSSTFPSTLKRSPFPGIQFSTAHAQGTHLDFLFIGEREDIAEPINIWKRTAAHGGLNTDTLLTNDLPGASEDELVAALLTKIRTMRQGSRITPATHIVLNFHGTLINGEVCLQIVGKAGSFLVKAAPFLDKLRRELANPGEQVGSNLVHLRSCWGGNLRLLLAKSRGNTFLYAGKKPAMADDSVDTINRLIQVSSRETRSARPLTEEQTQRLWEEAKAMTGENIAWISYRKLRRHDALEAVRNPGAQTRIDANKIRRVLYAKLFHGSLSSVQKALGPHPRQAIKSRFFDAPPLLMAAQSKWEAGPKIDYLIEVLGEDVNEVDHEKVTALEDAIRFGKADGVLRLILHDADALGEDDDGWLPLHYAAESSRDAEQKIEYLLAVDQHMRPDRLAPGGKSALHIAIEASKSCAVQTLLLCGADPDLEDDNGDDADALAQKLPDGEAKTSITTWLKVISKDVNRPDDNGEYSLHLTAALQSAAALKAALAQGACPWQRDFSGKLPLHHLAESSQQDTLEKLELLLKAGISIDATDLHGNTALHFAAAAGNADAVQALLQLGADPGLSNIYGVAPVHHATTSVLHWLMPALARRAADRPRPSLPPLAIVKLAGEGKDLSALIDQPGAVERRDAKGLSALFAAVVGGHPDVALYLLEQGAQANVRLSNGMSLLACAKALQADAMVQLLSAYGANPDW